MSSGQGDFEMIDVFCYRGHGYLPDAVIHKTQIRGEWAICPKCALGADPDVKCLREVHWARIVLEKQADRASTRRFIPKPAWKAVEKHKHLAGQFVHRDAKMRDGGFTVQGETKRSAVLRADEKQARAEGYPDLDAKLADLAQTERIVRRYWERLRAGSGG